MAIHHWIFAHFLEIVGYMLAIVLIPRILLERRHPGATLAWILAIGLLPYVGVPLYFLVGGKRIKRIVGKMDRPPEKYPDSFSVSGDEIAPSLNRISELMVRTGAYFPVTGNHCQVIDDGVEAYRVLTELIEEAETSIEITTFILGRDEVGRRLVALLARKARQGVKVKLLLDALGCFLTKGRFVQPLRDAGGQVGIFLPLLPLRSRWAANLRNHRKMIIVDGCQAMVGGMNLAKEYLGPVKNKKRWKDTVLLITGTAVGNLRNIFRHDWAYATGEKFKRVELHCPPDANGEMDSIVQVVADGPSYANRRPLYSGILAALNQAEESIWVVSPYFIPDESLSVALELAARMGRDVRLIMPEHSNHPLVDLAGNSFLPDLVDAGVQLYRYQPGMIHAKLIVIDGRLAVVGTVNMDIRSFQLNFELALFLYSVADITQVVAVVEKIIADSRLVNAEEIHQRGKVKEFVEDICRIFSPVL